MSQMSFGDAEYAGKRKKTRREIFLAEMEQVVPWMSLLNLIEPCYPIAGRGRHPYPLETMLRVHLMQNWFGLSDPAMEEALYEITPMRTFAGLTLTKAIPDETTILNRAGSGKRDWRVSEGPALMGEDIARKRSSAMRRPRRNHTAAFKAKVALAALYRKPNTSQRHPGHKIYPYLLRQLAIERADHVWAMDITYLPMQRGFIYLAAVMDWATRRVLSWRVSNTLTADFCVEAVEEAIARYGKPEIFNTDQGAQFTSDAFTTMLHGHGITISMDGRGCWRDNVFVERLWRSIKYEEVYLHAYPSVSAAEAGVGRYLEFYNGRRPHTALGDRTPDEAYFTHQNLKKAA